MKQRIFKIITSAIAILAICLLIYGGARLITYLTVDDSATYTRLMMDEFYNQDNIDILFVGASHFYRGINAPELSKMTGKDIFLASSSQQPMDASYAMVKEALKTYDTIDHIYLNISHSMALDAGTFKERTSLKHVYLVSDYLKPSFNKIGLILKGTKPDYYVNSFFSARREWNKLLDFAYVGNLVSLKRSEAYLSHDPELTFHDTEWYIGKGYVESIEEVSDRLYYSSANYYTINTKDISDDWKEAVLDIIHLCEKKGVAITLVEMPISDYVLASRRNYDDYIAFIKELIAGTKADYVDFNLLNEKYFPYVFSEYKDSDHLNTKGVERFMPILASYLNNDMPDDLFCASVKDKLAAVEPSVYGLARTTKKVDGVKYNLIRIVSNRPKDLEYKVEIIPDGGEYSLYQDFTSETHVYLPKGETGVITITYRPIDNPENESVYSRFY